MAKKGERDMLSCQHDKPDRPEVRDPPPKGPTGLAPLLDEVEPGGGLPDAALPPPEEPARFDEPEVRDPPPKGPTG
ncbi:hypothetical protein [Myxococcus sp. RHSTA-1-4]|uniref:hypothetical protein n=1 Tax=Myxococcus sp. RHSTA-1-4 TaxID=2874601 RepID=UPI001CC15DC9|nr:hypothetical protein [Myxococcus sp. RHSTA-1-4]MBZ4422428.1 hypothetical protein [Myxococcus sp. RHSTA-1-4]